MSDKRYKRKEQFNLTESSRRSLNQIKDSREVTLWKYALMKYPLREQTRTERRVVGESI